MASELQKNRCWGEKDGISSGSEQQIPQTDGGCQCSMPVQRNQGVVAATGFGLVLCAFGLLPVAEAKPAHCVVESGPGYVGPCTFSQFGGNGSFTLSRPQKPILPNITTISVTIVRPGEAEVRGLTTWGINSRWGSASRSRSDAACWVGTDFRICAY